MNKHAKQRQKLKSFIEKLKTDPKKLDDFIKKVDEKEK